MTVPAFGGCPWPMDPACKTAEWNAFDPDVQDRSLAMASATLQRLTGGRVTNCPVKVRPCTQPNLMMYYRNPWWDELGLRALNFGGEWRNITCRTSGCVANCVIRLPAPVGLVYEIKIDGNVVDVADYRVDGNSIVWQGTGDCPWPLVQDLAKDDNEVGTFSITYLHGYPVDSLGAYAVGVLALEFAKACTGQTCELPDNITTIVRQGITMEVVSGSFSNGETGLRAVDNFIGLWNPGHLRQAPRVWNPDLAGAVVSGSADFAPDFPMPEFDGGSA